MATRSGSRSGPIKYTLKLTADQIQLIGNALAERPYKEVAQTLADIQKQIAS